MPDPIYLPGGRDAQGTLDAAAPTAGDPVASGAAACVVACPPHPQHGGDRTDPRLRAVAEAVGTEGSDCLRFDYGPWDGGRGERTDALHAVEWAGERYDRVALFGYSFGGSVALSAAANGASVVAAAALAPPAHVGGAEEPSPGAHDGINAVADLGSLHDERDADGGDARDEREGPEPGPDGRPDARGRRVGRHRCRHPGSRRRPEGAVGPRPAGVDVLDRVSPRVAQREPQDDHSKQPGGDSGNEDEGVRRDAAEDRCRPDLGRGGGAEQEREDVEQVPGAESVAGALWEGHAGGSADGDKVRSALNCTRATGGRTRCI